jgi:hypothetical protein
MYLKSSSNSLIKNLAINLGIGDSTGNLLCPFCNGGDEKEHSFSVIRYRTIIYYKCYRAKCNQSGVIPTIPNTFIPEAKPKKLKKYKGYTSSLTKEDESYLFYLWGLIPEELSSQRFRKDDGSGDLVMPLFTYEGYNSGVILRRLDGRRPKTLPFWSEDVPKVHFPLVKEHTKSVFIVEDIPSAIKAARYMSSAALCGTNLSEDMISLLSTKFDTVYLALDADATEKAIKYRNKYCLGFRNFVVIPLSKDVKNMQDKDVATLTGGLLGEAITRSIP